MWQGPDAGPYEDNSRIVRAAHFGGCQSFAG
jgi:hypothetical protein